MGNRLFAAAQAEILLTSCPRRIYARMFRNASPKPAPAARRRWAEAHRHEHAHTELLFCLAGRDWYGCDERLYPAEPGDIFFFDARQPHQNGYPPGAAALEHLWISLLPDGFTANLIAVRRGQWNAQWPQPVLCLGETGSGAPTRADFGWPDEPEVDEPLRRRRFEAAAGALAALLVKRGGEAPAREERTAFQQRIMAALQTHIRDTAGSGVDLESLSRISGYGKFHLLRLFKKHTGRTVQEFVDHCRLERCAALTAEGRRQKEIAAVLGFSCPASFSRWRRRHGLCAARRGNTEARR